MAEADSVNDGRNEQNIKRLDETQDEQTDPTGQVNGTTHSDDLDEDAPDGMIFNYLRKPKGTYQPRKHEEEHWGSTVGQLPETKDPHECLCQLLKNTAPEVRWREGLFCMLKEARSEASTRKVLTFLHSNVASGIKAIEDVGYGEMVHAGDNSAPKCMTCPHWMLVMEGLHFDLTSPRTEHDVNNVDVVIGKNTDIVALTGFCHLMKAMLDLSWTHLQMLSWLEDSDGQLLHKTLKLLCSGYGTSVSYPDKLDEMESKYPYLMKSLGFHRIGQYDQLQWQIPDPNQEFQCLYLIFNGLFSSDGEMESVL